MPADDHTGDSGESQEPDGPEDSRRAILLDAAATALAAAAAGDDSAAVEQLIDFVVAAPDGRTEARELVLLLFSECSTMVSALGASESTGVKMQVFDSAGQELSIDDADPAVRTAVRILLAEVHGDTDAAREQVEIALGSAEPSELATIVLQAVRWTIRLSGECTSRDIPTPEWIRAALGD